MTTAATNRRPSGRRRGPSLLGLALAATLLIGPSSMSASASVNATSPTPYYVVLGDSIAAGFEATTPALTYPGLIYAREQPLYPGLGIVSYACGGATTNSMLRGPACKSTTGSQLHQAESFLTAHEGHVALVTLDIGVNDIYNCLLPPAIRTGCVKKGLSQLSSQLPVILRGLKLADPGVPIVAMNYYDPFLVYWLNGTHTLARDTLKIIQNLNAKLKGVYGKAGVRMANVFSAYHSADFTGVPYNGSTDPQNVVTLCRWTNSCKGDPHPTNPGHQVIAQAFYPLLPTGKQ